MASVNHPCYRGSYAVLRVGIHRVAVPKGLVMLEPTDFNLYRTYRSLQSWFQSEGWGVSKRFWDIYARRFGLKDHVVAYHTHQAMMKRRADGTSDSLAKTNKRIAKELRRAKAKKR